ncbi:MAG: FixH family protein [Gemmatimonadetes bacterium]|nr:FixH family protein [Gemmatimonadota bacterium]MBL0179319.1 FixH family protein [Gemmatimonadota bacterium]
MKSPFSKERIWPTMITAALLGNVVLGVVLVRLAGGDRHFAVESNYYQKAIGWDSTMAQDGRNAALGWVVSPSLGAVRAGGRDTLVVTLHTAAGEPVIGAAVTLEAMPIAYAGEVARATLMATGEPGEYATAGLINRAGLWELRLAAVRGTDRFTENLRLDASTTAVATVVTARPGDAPK